MSCAEFHAGFGIVGDSFLLLIKGEILCIWNHMVFNLVWYYTT